MVLNDITILGFFSSMLHKKCTKLDDSWYKCYNVALEHFSGANALEVNKPTACHIAKKLENPLF